MMGCKVALFAWCFIVLVCVCAYPVRTECGHPCGGQDLLKTFFIISLSLSSPFIHLYTLPSLLVTPRRSQACRA